jgi:hypothetical protein
MGDSRMRRRSGYNPKRRVDLPEAWSSGDRQALATSISYEGNPEHKRTPGDYGATPPRNPRPRKTLCDAEGPFLKAEAETLLKAGASKGLVSVQRRGSWPQNIWAVSGSGAVFEAQLGNLEQGVYHGYPMPADDDFREVVIREWSRR